MYNYNNFIYDNSDYLVLIKLETFNRTASGKSWKSKPTETSQRIYTPVQYTNYITAIPFFNNFGDGAYCRGKWEYTMAGYLPTIITTVSPFRTVKKKASFLFIKKSRLLNRAGWREKEIVKNAKSWKMEVVDGKKYLHIFTNAEGVTASGCFDFAHNVWRA